MFLGNAACRDWERNYRIFETLKRLGRWASRDRHFVFLGNAACRDWERSYRIFETLKRLGRWASTPFVGLLLLVACTSGSFFGMLFSIVIR